MKVLIMSDMEGVSGIVTWKQVEGGSPMFEEGRRLYTEEINAAVRQSISLTPDIRSNTVIVRAPKDSMALVEKMIEDLDHPVLRRLRGEF